MSKYFKVVISNKYVEIIKQANSLLLKEPLQVGENLTQV